MAWMQLVHSCTDGHVTYQLQQVHSVRPFPAALSSLASDHSRHSDHSEHLAFSCFPCNSRIETDHPQLTCANLRSVCWLLLASSDDGCAAADASDGLGHAAARAVRELPLGLQLRRLPLLLARLQGPRQPGGAAVLRLGLDAVLRADGLRHGRPELLRRGAAEHVHDDGLRRDAVHAHAGGQQDRHGPGCGRNHSSRICLCDLLTKNLQL